MSAATDYGRKNKDLRFNSLKSNPRQGAMQELPFSIPPNCDLIGAEELIEQICSEAGLQLTMKGSLATYPGCIHWHFRKPREKGTFEVTLFRPPKRIWAKVQAGRNAAWIEPIALAIRAEIEEALMRSPKATEQRRPRQHSREE